MHGEQIAALQEQHNANKYSELGNQFILTLLLFQTQKLIEVQNQQQTEIRSHGARIQNQGTQIQNLIEAQSQQHTEIQNKRIQIQNLGDTQDQQQTQIQIIKSRQDVHGEQIAALQHLHNGNKYSENMGNYMYFI